MNKKFLLGLFFILPLILFSCEYELDDTNTLTVEKPSGDPFLVELNASKNEKGEYVVNYPFIKYTADFPVEVEKNYRQISLWREGSNYPMYIIEGYSDNYLSLYSYLDAGNYILKYTVSIPSGSGSLADKTGNEWLGNSYEWKIKWDPKNYPRLNLQYEITEPGKARLTWDKPDPDYAEAIHYIVKADQWYGEEIITTDTFCEFEISDYYTGVYVYAIFEDSIIPYLRENVNIYN